MGQKVSPRFKLLTRLSKYLFNQHMTTSPDPHVKIRAYRAADWPHICAIHDAARKVELGEANLTAGAFLPLEKCAQDEKLFGSEIIVAEYGEQVVGFAAYNAHRLAWLYVAPRHFGEGIGQQLIRHVLNHTERPLDVQMLDGNRRAQRLYQYMGFEIYQRTQGHIEGMSDVPATGLTLRLR